MWERPRDPFITIAIVAPDPRRSSLSDATTAAADGELLLCIALESSLPRMSELVMP